MKKNWLITIVAFAVQLMVGLICWPYLPDNMATNWSWRNQPYDYMTKTCVVIIWSLFGLAPAVVLAIHSVVVYYSKIKNDQTKQLMHKQTTKLLILLTLMLILRQGLMLSWNLGLRFPFRYLDLAVSAVFFPAMFIILIPALKIGVAESRRAGQNLPKNIWFPANSHGWGWGLPCRWQGWVAMALVILVGQGTAIMFIFKKVASDAWKAVLILMLLLLANAIMIGICYIKGEKKCRQCANTDAPK